MRPSRIFLAGLLVVARVLGSDDAEAQCGAKHSSCSACHDGARGPLPSHEPWHEDHAFADLCPVCHGGRADTNDATEAHAGLAAPLGDDGERCASCHAESRQAFVDRYQVVRHRDAGAAPPGAADCTLPLPPSARSGLHPHGEPGPNLALAGVVAAVGLVGLALVVRRERERRGRATKSSTPSMSPV